MTRSPYRPNPRYRGPSPWWPLVFAVFAVMAVFVILAAAGVIR
jgi:hypothetical protein